MICIDDKSMCCGCATCEMVCPCGAIHMNEDEAGFLFPFVQKEKCIDCGLCEKKCPVLNHKNEKDLSHKFYAAYASDKETRYKGSSGGIFGVIAKQFVAENAVVYGAAFDESLKLRCTGAEDEQSLQPLYKSKYLQSNIGNKFFEIKKHLENGRKVLFVSTPCQVYALKLFLGQEYDNLFTLDFVCHGVPSQSFFDKCKNFVEQKENIKILDFSFRAKKKNGATPHYYKMRYKKNGCIKEKINLYFDSPFYYAFQKYITLRDSCYDCHFSHSNRVSDITIADFHEVDKYVKGINRFDGVSSVVVNTKKGETIWQAVKDKTIFTELDFSILLNNKELMCESTKKPPQREMFIEDLCSLSFEDFARKHLNGNCEYVKKMYYLLPKAARKILKKVLIK